MNNFVSAHAGFISILLVTAIGVNGIFVDKDVLASWFYSLCSDEYDFFLAPLLTNRSKQDILQTGQFGSRGGRVPVAIFKSKQEQSQFEVFLTQRPIKDNELVNFPTRQNDPYITETDKEIISYSNAVLTRLEEYRGLML